MCQIAKRRFDFSRPLSSISPKLTVKRTYWHQVEGPPKTEARGNAVHLLPEVVTTLAEHRKKNPHTVYVFEGPRQTRLTSKRSARSTSKPRLKEAACSGMGFMPCAVDWERVCMLTVCQSKQCPPFCGTVASTSRGSTTSRRCRKLA